ncbi:ion channel [Ancylobacter radicis]|uniref:Two pore domain potassium channel family protein n=1 Tax=Ancylobacter radicis TaxID=2836179 RepID=A0ABS5RC49_9HYPH|nr:ion channel [Ancylobacter radicis]MBS9479245.1 two pore domain potassium channel family protein [Ancylobacter radicis]
MNIAVMLVHLGATFLLIALVRPFESRLWGSPYLRLMLALLTTNALLLCAHLFEVGLWSLLYGALGLVADPADAYYSAFVNYTTLGYGDVLQATRTRLLGPMAAGSGILMFGWSTALLIYVLQGHLPHLTDHRSAPR